MAGSQLWRISIQRLGRDLSEASELATVFQEVSPDLQVDGISQPQTSRPCSSSGSLTPLSVKERVLAAQPIDIGPAAVRWQDLRGAVSSELLHESADGSTKEKPQLLEVNTGGSVFFLVFGQEQARSRLGPPQQEQQVADSLNATFKHWNRRSSCGGDEGIAVLKVASSRLAMQAEQFANELARHLGIAAPLCRLVRQAGDGAGEWSAARDAAELLGEGGDELSGELGRMPCFLLMEYVAGRPLLGCPDAFQGPDSLPLLEDVGRLLLLDMLLGNADRLPFPDLGWRGNPHNVLLGAPGSKHAGRAVAIDSCVARRPPALKSCAEDAAVERMAQLILMASDVAQSVLQQLLGSGAGPSVCSRDGVAAFQRGFRETLTRVLRIKGLLEMMHCHTAEWVAEFFDDVQPLVPGLKGPQGIGCLPLGELAAGMRTPTHLSPRPASCSSARMSPRSSFHNRDFGCSNPGQAASPSFVRASIRGTRSFTLGNRAPSGSLAAGVSPLPPVPPTAPASAAPLNTQQLPSLAAVAAAVAGPPDALSPGRPASVTPAGDPLSPAATARGPMPRLMVPRPLFSSPGGNNGEQRSAALGSCDSSEGVRRMSCDEPAWGRSPSINLGFSPQRSPRDPLDVSREASRVASATASLSQAVSSALASITSEARHDEALAERVALWKDRFRDRGATLAAAITAWQSRQSLERVLTTGFLDGSHPLVDAYELSVRLEHMLRRLVALQGAATAEAPVQVAPRLFLGGAVTADSHHLLAHMGITHILNATEELLLPPPSMGFDAIRVALTDTDMEDIGFHFDRVKHWIDDALADGGSVLVHCHEGKSRSVTLVAAYLMDTGMDLATALARIRSVRPAACPNAGFMAALLDLDERLHGACSINPEDGTLCKRGKPAARTCPICGDIVGVSSGSLNVHMRARHRTSEANNAASVQ